MTFWYGLGFDEIARMPTAAIWAYLERLPGLQAEARLHSIEAAMIPHIKDRDRNRAFRRLDRQMRRDDEAKPSVTRNEFQARLALVGIGFKTVPAKPVPAKTRETTE